MLSFLWERKRSRIRGLFWYRVLAYSYSHISRIPYHFKYLKLERFSMDHHDQNFFFQKFAMHEWTSLGWNFLMKKFMMNLALQNIDTPLFWRPGKLISMEKQIYYASSLEFHWYTFSKSSVCLKWRISMSGIPRGCYSKVSTGTYLVSA